MGKLGQSPAKGFPSQKREDMSVRAVTNLLPVIFHIRSATWVNFLFI